MNESDQSVLGNAGVGVKREYMDPPYATWSVFAGLSTPRAYQKPKPKLPSPRWLETTYSFPAVSVTTEDSVHRCHPAAVEGTHSAIFPSVIASQRVASRA